MREKKFRFKTPAGPDECREAIYEELTTTSEGTARKEIVTLKDYVVEVVTLLRSEKREREYQTEDKDTPANRALIVLAIVAALFLWFGSTSLEHDAWLVDYQFPIKLWGIAFTAVFLGVSIERSSIFQSLWAFGFTKVVTSIAVSALLIVSTAKAAALMNTIFPIDASALPFTRAITAGLIAFQYLYPLLIVVALFTIINAFDTWTWILDRMKQNDSSREFPLRSLIFFLLSLVLLAFINHWVRADFSERALPYKVYRLAHALDFNTKHACSNLPQGLSVVFLGHESRVLVDMYAAKTDDMRSFIDEAVSSQVRIPGRFYLLACDTSPPPEPGKNPE